MALVLSDGELAMLMPEGKTKQEEIREGIATLIQPNCNECGDLGTKACDSGGEAPCHTQYTVSNMVLSYLHSQGVVIKVDKDLPVSIPVLPKFHKQGIITDDDLLEYAKLTEVLNRMEYIKAGFEAVETIAPSDAGMSR